MGLVRTRRQDVATRGWFPDHHRWVVTTLGYYWDWDWTARDPGPCSWTLRNSGSGSWVLRDHGSGVWTERHVKHNGGED